MLAAWEEMLDCQGVVQVKAGSGCGVYTGARARNRWLRSAHQQQAAAQPGRRGGLGANPDALQDQSVLPR